MKELYNKKINERSIFKYFLGLLSRIRLYLKYGLIRMYARIRGAYIGRNSIITWKLACRANKNLVIGNDCIVESWNIDLRSKVEICDNVIINRDVVIIRVSHYIDNDKSFTTRFYPDLKIEMYCWLVYNITECQYYCRRFCSRGIFSTYKEHDTDGSICW